MKRQVEWARGRPEESAMRNLESAALGASGQVRLARELCQQAVELAQSHGLKEEAAGYIASEAGLEAILGDDAEARQRAKKALAISRGVGVRVGAAYALAHAWRTGRGQDDR